MKVPFLSVLSASAVLLGVSVLPSAAQKHYYPDRVIVPASSVEVMGLPHTNLVLLKTTQAPRAGAHPLDGLGPGGGISPAQLLTFYAIKKVGGANAIAVIEAGDNGNALKDFNGFSKQFNLPQETSTNVTASTNKVLQVVYQGGFQPPTNLGYGWDLEEDLDMQWAHAMAPKAKIYVVEAQDQDHLFEAVAVAASLVGIKEVSNSWAYGEFTGENTYDTYFPTGKGIVFLASSGDSGAFYGLGYPAASPNVVSVGGTTEISDTNGKLIAHWGWEGGGGGVSGVETKPSYQDGVLNTDPTYRSNPDVAAVADPYTGVSVYASYYYSYYGIDV